MKRKVFSKEEFGFTLLELVISTGILVLAGVMFITSFLQSRNTRDLVSSGQNVLAVLRLAQARSLGGANNNVWGVHLTGSQYELFRGTTYVGGTVIETFVVPNTLEIANITLAGGGVDVIFDRLTGATIQSGTFLVRVKGSTTKVFSVTVDPSGKVYQTGTAPTPVGTRVLDTRHRNFALAGTIKNSTTMALTFTDPTQGNYVVPIAMTPAAPRTTFSWSGTVTAFGQPQVLTIHAVSIGDAATTLSVDRDCRQNSKKLKITFDASDVATYEADCQTVTVWAFGGTVSEP